MSRRARTAVGGVVVVVVAAAAAAATIGFGGRSPSTASATTLPPATAKVIRGTLTQTTQVSGTLDYGDTSTLSARAGLGSGDSSPSSSNPSSSPSGSPNGSNPSGSNPNGNNQSSTGTITWLPAAGASVGRGKPAYKVDDQPVPLLYGGLPLYRVLKVGVSGADVKELESNLHAMGYTGFTVDEDFTTATADAVKAWQSDLGLTQTGTVDINQVAVAPGAVRVTALKAAVGQQATGDVFTYTGTTRVVDVALDVSLQSLVKAGVKATVTLPGGTDVQGTVSSVGTVASTSSNDNNNPNSSSTTTIDVVVSVADQHALGTLDAAPVDVTLVSQQADNVLSVPVSALVALAE
ncbi:MAG: peptidoglycan-binding protein, partial [Micromonosporaceae bacterium]|nr:peptidoglycan-binding protein [Micromonosporaceae bacterium]